MPDDPKDASPSSAWRVVFRSVCVVSAGVLLLTVIAFSRASTEAGPASQLATTSSDAAAGASELVNTFAVSGPTTTPFPCPPCWQQLSFSENFDAVPPPALPGWLTTNAQGPPPLWVASNSGVPMPPADTPPNAAFVDDPAVVSDKRLDSPQLTFLRAAGYV